MNRLNEETIVKCLLEIRMDQIKHHNEIKEILFHIETYLKNRLGRDLSEVMEDFQKGRQNARVKA
jgi:hypothetical protein